MLAMPDGALLAFAECRRWAGDQCFVDGHLNATRAQESNRSICMRRSEDGGTTWDALRPNITQRLSANPSALHDASRNRTLLFFDDAQSG
jgi:Neuraminidase (sialidase)